MGGHDVSLGDEETAADHSFDDMEDGEDVDDDVTNSEEQPQDDSRVRGILSAGQFTVYAADLDNRVDSGFPKPADGIPGQLSRDDQ